MSRKLILTCLVLVAMLMVTLTVSVLAAPNQPDIVGGEEAAPGAWPWQVALIHADATNLYDGQYCGGVLVDEFWVLTAAHCIDNSDTADFDIALGVFNLLDPEPNYQRIPPNNIIINPDYNPETNDSDIALIRLETPAVITEGEAGGLPVQPATLIAPDVGSLVGILSTVTGWGNRLPQPDPGGYDYSETLYQVEVPIVSNEACSAAYENNYLYAQVTENMMCAGFIYKGGHDACQGDSGGPLVIQKPDSEEWQLAGLVSWGSGCGVPGLPGVYTRVSQFTNWVNGILETPNVTIKKSTDTSAVIPGGIIAYNLMVKNDGSQMVEALNLTDTVPGGTMVVPGSISADGELDAGTISWNIPVLAMNETFSADFSVMVDENYLDTANYFFDDMEGDQNVWSVAHDPDLGDDDWSLTDSWSFSPSHAWFALDPPYLSDQYLILSVPGILPPEMMLIFRHYYDIEEGYDGGVIEISTDGGTTWSDLGLDIVENGYDLQLYGGTYNPLAGRFAFSGSPFEWLQTRVDLKKYSGEEIKIRFRLGSDEIYGNWGWFVDDVLIGRSPNITNQAWVKSVSSNITETAVLSWLPTHFLYAPFLVSMGEEDISQPGYRGPNSQNR
jgi:uncharacterized repeat protein (TIGR01451 family)